MQQTAAAAAACRDPLFRNVSYRIRCFVLFYVNIVVLALFSNTVNWHAEVEATKSKLAGVDRCATDVLSQLIKQTTAYQSH